MDGVEECIERRYTNQYLDIHPSRNALVLHYTVEVVAFNEYGEPIIADSKECVKIINVKNVTRSIDVSSLAQEVMASCSILDQGALSEVEQLLLYMQARKRTKEGDAEMDVLETATKKLQKQMEDLEGSEEASMIDLESYLEGLYEDLPSKVRVTGLILQLARMPDNLLELASNSSLFLALTRVLRDDWKKSIDLTTNIVYIFFCFSTFSDFHRMLIRHKIGSSCMSVVDHEIKRHQSLMEDVAKKKKEVKSGTAEAKKDYERSKKKCQHLLKKQETLLRVALYLLLNLAEDTRVELKMRNKNLISHLITLLERESQELLILVVSFLKKLSIFRENKDAMAQGEVIKKLMRVIPCNNEILVNVTLRLLLNLSFDQRLRQDMIRTGFLPKLTALFDTESHQKVVLNILYHISYDRQSRSVFAYTDCVPRVMRLIIECPDELLDPEAISLGINLACTLFGAQQMCKGPGLKLLMRRALKTRDSLLLKMLRNVSQHPGPTKKLFLGYIPELATIVLEGKEEAVVEALGILGNLNLPDIDFGKVVRDLKLLPFITTKLKDPGVEDDLLLEVVLVCSTFCMDEACAAMLTEAELPSLLITLLKAKQEDDELVLQIVYVFYHLILSEATRSHVLTGTQAVDYLLELMTDKNKEISKLCSKTLDIVAIHSQELAQRIKGEKFRFHNSRWLELTTGESMYEGESEEEEDEDYLDHYLLHSAAELDNPEYYYPIPGELEGPEGPEHVLLSDTQQYYPVGGAPLGYLSPGSPIPPHSSPYEGEVGRMTALAVGGGRMMHLHGGGVEGGRGGGGGRGRREGVEAGSLSPKQYSTLMRSMEDPLAMYSASFGQEGMDYPADPGELQSGWFEEEEGLDYGTGSAEKPMLGAQYYQSSIRGRSPSRKGF